MHGTLRILLALLLAALSTFVAAQDTGRILGRELSVGTRHVPPFAMKVNGEWDGIAIELLRKIGAETGLSFDFKQMTLQQMLDAIVKGEVDAAAAALTITAEREQVMDFTHPFYSSGLGVAVRQRPEVTWLSAMKRIASGAFVQSLGALLGVLTLVGTLVWFVEHRRNRQFQGDLVKGIGSGVWWSAVTMTTVGYGDKAPMTLAGRVIGLVWMFASIILISGFTAAIASSLTVGELGQTVRGVDDLRGKRVLSLGGSTSAAYLNENLIRYKAAPDLNDALTRLADGRADAVVYDAPVLRFLINESYSSKLRVLPTVFAKQDYGIALPPGSPLREQLNRHILSIIQSPEWDRMLKAYLGPEG